MINSLIKIIATNYGPNWWCITNKYLCKDIVNVLDWYDIIYTKNERGLWFEYDLQKVEIAATIKMLELLRTIYGLQQWPKIKNINIP